MPKSQILAVLVQLAAGAAELVEPKPPPACVGFSFLYFDSGSSEIDSLGRAILDNFALLLKESAMPSRVEIAGHADRVGSEGGNLRLSRRRTEAVRAYLVGKGHPASHIELAAYGETRPLIETADETPERQNRNVSLFEKPTEAEMQRREAIWARIGRPNIVC